MITQDIQNATNVNNLKSLVPDYVGLIDHLDVFLNSDLVQIKEQLIKKINEEERFTVLGSDLINYSNTKVDAKFIERNGELTGVTHRLNEHTANISTLGDYYGNLENMIQTGVTESVHVEVMGIIDDKVTEYLENIGLSGMVTGYIGTTLDNMDTCIGVVNKAKSYIYNMVSNYLESGNFDSSNDMSGGTMGMDVYLNNFNLIDNGMSVFGMAIKNLITTGSSDMTVDIVNDNSFVFKRTGVLRGNLAFILEDIDGTMMNSEFLVSVKLNSQTIAIDKCFVQGSGFNKTSCKLDFSSPVNMGDILEIEIERLSGTGGSLRYSGMYNKLTLNIL